MPLTTSLDMLRDAMDGGYAVGAFNAENMEMVQAILSAAEEARAPVMIQTTPGTLRHASPSVFLAMAEAASGHLKAPAAVHLDHGDSLAIVARALRAGYTSIMIDGSREILEENIAITRSAVELCSACGVPVEGELGRVGGKEDGMEDGGGGYTDPAEAEAFVHGTGVSFLAVGVGTAHGVYRDAPKLNTALIGELRKLVPVPLVLHGASGLADDVVRECVSLGIAKVNFATELRMAYTGAVRRALAASPAAFDPKSYSKAGREAVRSLVLEKIRVCGSAGKAPRPRAAKEVKR
ncbi:MAG: class II fructose-bisphosphate aldolase [Deltaproteobacteria bacterium]|jgi:tagatose 1,6-diphosphate aldolase GatY/KbaY|nr:class II fructose-bisphosphate aldolase [Deltaproteobacteria bacterium]